MSGPRERIDGARLADDPELGALLRRANREYRAGLDESGAFRRASDRLDARAAGPRRAASVAAFGLACAAAGWWAWVGVTPGASSEVTLGPEISATATRMPQAATEARRLAEPPAPAEPPAATEARSPAEPQVLAEPPAPAKPQVLAEPPAPAEPRRAAIARETPKPRSAPAPAKTPRATRGTDARAATTGAAAPRVVPPRDDCLSLARQGDPRAAERCFDRRASGGGLGAEQALYEMARLRRDVLRDAAGALAAFGAYRDRFARGSLRGEVELSRVELLVELGQGSEALRDSAALLATSSGRAHRAELRLLRGEVYRELGDLRGAAAEYAQVEALGGPRAADATRARAACLEALGDVAGALAAYRRYASVPGRPHAADVAARIERLAAASRSPR